MLFAEAADWDPAWRQNKYTFLRFKSKKEGHSFGKGRLPKQVVSRKMLFGPSSNPKIAESD